MRRLEILSKPTKLFIDRKSFDMSERRIQRINSLLKEVISDVIRKEVKNPHLITEFITVTHVEITKDLRHAKVYVSIMGEDQQRKKSIEALQSASGFIGVQAAKQIVLRYFPELIFYLDTSIDEQIHLDQLISDIRTERESRGHE